MSSQNTAAATTYPMSKIARQYLMILLVCIVGVFALIWIAESVFKLDAANNGAMGLLVVMFAAMPVAVTWYEREGGRPASGRIWKATLLCGLVNVAVQGALAALLLSTGIVQDMLGSPAGLQPGQMQILLPIMLGALLVQGLFIRLGLGMGFRQAVKQAKAKADRAARS